MLKIGIAEVEGAAVAGAGAGLGAFELKHMLILL
tara:strand:- start:1646 stop:1747 length:102 start_codon:yes stop_codon:yes gene_type:complete